MGGASLQRREGFNWRVDGTRPYEMELGSDETEIQRCMSSGPLPASIRLGCGDVIQAALCTRLPSLLCCPANGCTPSSQTEVPIFDGAILNSRERFPSGDKGGWDRNRLTRFFQCIHIGGDFLLWRLHRLNGIDQHNMIVTTFGNITAINHMPPIQDQMDRKPLGPGFRCTPWPKSGRQVLPPASRHHR